MSVPKIPINIVIICIIFALIGALWGSHAAGLLNLTSVLADLPIIGGKFAVVDEGVSVEISPLEDENKALKEKIQELESQLANFKTTEMKYQEEIAEYNNQISKLENQIKIIEEKEVSSAKMGEYYSQMKPKEIAPIFDNLDDEIILDILVKLDANIAAKILAELEPLRVAKLTRLLTDIN
ncbi:MAG: hypothetical protein VR72_01350 [Clostridiaceae bacterium BRH_c20a]|nr:MAG: hypothetical protein VR72_01350 [Clostridiaceae bacterium BRH_c20a]